jgi:drug/metabolite transporter (DMT)-like permease
MTAAMLITTGRWPFAACVAEARRLRSSRNAVTGLSIVFLCYTVSTALSKVSLAYISVPLQVVVKSAKIIPVMIGGRFITGKRYSGSDYAGACLLAAGVALFSGAGGNLSAAAGDSSAGDALAIGLGLLAVTLCCDALLGNWQERTMRDAAIPPQQMMLLQALFAAALSAIAAHATGELRSGIALLYEAGGGRLAFLLLCYAAVMLMGTTAILVLVEERGAAAAVLVTLLRKCSSMLFSFILWPKPVGARHLIGAAMVFAAPFAAQHASKRGSSAAVEAAPRAQAEADAAQQKC